MDTFTGREQESLYQAVRPVCACNPQVSRDQYEWYALHTRCRHEKQVAAQLEQRGVEIFLPLMKEGHNWSDRRKIIEVPLFSCYVFVRFALGDHGQRKRLHVPGALRLVGFHDGPAAIPRWEIEAVQKVVSSTGACSSCQFLRVGQKVRIRGGSLDGIEGLLVGRNGDRKLVISINLIQQSLAVVVEGYHIERVR